MRGEGGEEKEGGGRGEGEREGGGGGRRGGRGEGRGRKRICRKNQIQCRMLQEVSKCKVMLEEGGRRKPERERKSSGTNE